VNFRGTEEYASLNALKGRTQTRWDDLIAWMYTMLELYNPTSKVPDMSLYQLPWTGQDNIPACYHMKSPQFPAHALLRHCPEEWFPIRNHLYLSDRRSTPNYEMIKTLLEKAYGKMKITKVKKTKKKKRSAKVQDLQT